MRKLTHKQKTQYSGKGSYVNRATDSLLRRTKRSIPNQKQEGTSDDTLFSSGPQFSFGRISVFPKTETSLQPKLSISEPVDWYEREADRVANQVMRMPAPALQRKCAGSGGTQAHKDQGDKENLQTKRKEVNNSVPISGVPGIVRAALQSPGQPLAANTSNFMASRFGYDFGHVRVHTGSLAEKSARAVNALAYTVGRNVVFGQGQYAPSTTAGQQLLAHELTHVMQQEGATTQTGWNGAPAGIQRRVELRDVGRGEQSGISRRQEFVDRLNSISTALVFTINATGVLSYTENPYGTETEFDRKMKTFIDSGSVLPLRLTTRQGLLRTTAGGPFNARVDADAWASGYVDVDDMLASDDLGFQVVLIHFLTERAATKDYARRIGTMDDTSAEFRRVHASGVTAEVELLRDFFGDPTIRLLNDGSGPGGVFRTYRNSRGDTIRARTPPSPRGVFGLDANLMDVQLRDGTIMSVDDYRELLETERIRRQVERERLSGATEHRAGGRSVPAP
jgi:hypothetical protein